MFDRTPFTKIEYPTSFSTQSETQLHNAMTADSKNMEAKTEFVLRAINGDKELTKEAFNICNQILESNAGHPFFNLARGMLGNIKECEPFFKVAILSTFSSTSADKKIQAQAAYQLARLLFDQGKYLESQAWLMKSVILGHDKAEIDFCGRGMARDFIRDTIENYFHQLADPSAKVEETPWWAIPSDDYRKAINYAIMTAIILSGKKLHYLDKMNRDSNTGCYFIADDSFWNSGYHTSWITSGRRLEAMRFANETISPAAALLNQDTMLHKVAYSSLYQGPGLFFEFMSYCAKNNILARDAYQNILTFIETFSRSKNKNLLLEEGKNILSELSFSQPSKEPTQPLPIPLKSTANVMQVLQNTNIAASSTASANIAAANIAAANIAAANIAAANVAAANVAAANVAAANVAAANVASANVASANIAASAVSPVVPVPQNYQVVPTKPPQLSARVLDIAAYERQFPPIPADPLPSTLLDTAAFYQQFPPAPDNNIQFNIYPSLTHFSAEQTTPQNATPLQPLYKRPHG